MKTDHPISIRPIGLDDAERVSELSTELGYPANSKQMGARILSISSKPDHLALAAVHAGAIVGWIHAYVSYSVEHDPRVEIGGLIVTESFRGKGAGRALVRAVEQWAIGLTIDTLRVRSQVKRLATHQFYEHLGFTETKRQAVFTLSLIR